MQSAAAPSACPAPAPPSPAPPPPSSAALPPAAVAEDPATHERGLSLLRGAGARFSTRVHAPTATSAESAAARGAPLASGAKAMLLKAAKPVAALGGALYVLAVLSAARGADLKALKALLGAPRLSLASIEEVRALTGCVPGAVPPFGSLFPGVATVVDASLREQGSEINFNAGLRSVSVTGLSVDEYLAVERPKVVGAWSAPL